MEEEFHNHMRIPWHDYTRKVLVIRSQKLH